uniref:ATP synthase subunit a n=1 Tax=Xenos vesparum TaxID=31928 RepID=B7ZE90_9NEOP|nr:ATPase subunit 6 [Xenos vesparum]
MMMNLFSSFDPSTNLFSSNWVLTLFFISLWVNFWMKKSPIMMIFNTMENFLKKMVFMNKVIFSVFMMVFISNFYGQMPHIFPLSSHLSFTMSLALPLWLSSMIKSCKFMNLFFYKMIPASTPTALMPLMSLIELLSLMIRPVTLSIRLMANLTSGHLMMNFISSMNLMMNLEIMMELTYLLMEMFISLIQAYIFVLLISLYYMN